MQEIGGRADKLGWWYRILVPNDAAMAGTIERRVEFAELMGGT